MKTTSAISEEKKSTKTKKEKKKKALPPLSYIDAGANLNHPKFRQDLDQVLKFSQERGVQYIITICNDLKSVHRIVNMCQDNFGQLRCTVGVHPHNANSFDAKKDVQTIRNLLKKQWRVISAVGETGLDYNRMFSTQENQVACFEAHVKLACEEKKALYIHERDAHHDLVEILKKYEDKLPRVLIHCFTGSEKQLDTYLEMGFYIGVTGYLTKTIGENLRNFIHKVPLDKIVVETDAPFMVPYSVSDLLSDPRRNEPGTIPNIAKALCECYNRARPEAPYTQQEFSEILWKNAKSFFSII